MYSIGDLEELGWYMAAALALGPAGVVSHLSALMLLGLRPHEPGDIQDADLAPHELYRALEEAERSGHDVHLLNGVVRLRQAVRGRTRSDAEARFILLCHEHRLPLPLVNHRLNGIETDFHWPRARLVVEVDGYEFHHLKEQFEEDRRRGLVHAAAGYTVIRVSAKQVQHAPALIARALRQTTGW